MAGEHPQSFVRYRGNSEIVETRHKYDFYCGDARCEVVTVWGFESYALIQELKGAGDAAELMTLLAAVKEFVDSLQLPAVVMVQKTGREQSLINVYTKRYGFQETATSYLRPKTKL